MDYNRIYAYTTVEVQDKEWVGKRKGKGLIKVGQTTQDVEERVKRQLQGSPSILKDNGYYILLDEEALNLNGEYFKDHEVFKWLKAMGVHRIPKTEWFEATLDEVKEAFRYASNGTSLRGMLKDKQDNVEKRGSKYNKEEARRERNFIKSEDRIIRILELYPEANTLVKIGKKFAEHYKIKQYSPSTISNFIGEKVKELIEAGIIENKNAKAYTNPNLVLTGKKWVKTELSTDVCKPTITLRELKSLIQNTPEGVTAKDIEKLYNIPNKSWLYELLKKNFIQIKVPYNGEGFRGLRVKYIAPQNYQQKTEEVIESSSYTEEDYLKVVKAMKSRRTSIIKGKIVLSKLIKKLGLSTAQFRQIIEDKFPRYLVLENKGELKLYYKCDNIIGEQERNKIREMKRNEDITTLLKVLEERPKGLVVNELAQILEWSTTRVYQRVKEARAQGALKKAGSTLYHSDCYFKDPLLDSLPMCCQFKARRYGVTKELLLNMIKNNPYCNSSFICLELNKRFNLDVSDGYFDSLVAAAKRAFIKDGLIVETSGTGNLHIKDEEHSISISKVNIDVEKVLMYVRTNKGATTKEIHSFLKGRISNALLYNKLGKIPELVKVRVIKTGMSTYCLKWFLKGSELNLREDEELYSSLLL